MDPLNFFLNELQKNNTTAEFVNDPFDFKSPQNEKVFGKKLWIKIKRAVLKFKMCYSLYGKNIVEWLMNKIKTGGIKFKKFNRLAKKKYPLGQKMTSNKTVAKKQRLSQKKQSQQSGQEEKKPMPRRNINVPNAYVYMLCARKKFWITNKIVKISMDPAHKLSLLLIVLVTSCRYVGQTTDIEQRLTAHYKKRLVVSKVIFKKGMSALFIHHEQISLAHAWYIEHFLIKVIKRNGRLINQAASLFVLDPIAKSQSIPFFILCMMLFQNFNSD